MKLGKVSIIIPIFNSADFLAQTLDSIISQTYLNFECICVDDGSTDKSAKIVKAYSEIDSRIISFDRPTSMPKGGNSCRNFGFSVSEGEFVQWFDSDDLMDIEFIQEKVRFLNSSDYSYVISRTGYFHDDINSLVEYDQNLYSPNIYYDFLTYKTKFFTPGPMFKRDFLSKMDLFDLKLKRHQEKEFFFRVLLRDSKYGVIDKVSIFRRMHDAQLSSSFNDPRLKLKHEFFCWDRIFESYQLSRLNIRQLDKYFRDLFLKYSYRFMRYGEFNLAYKCLKNLVY